MLILQLLRKKLGFEYDLKAVMNFETIVKMARNKRNVGRMSLP